MRTAEAPIKAWSLEALAGRFVELSAGPEAAPCSLTAAAALLIETQLAGEPVVWILVGTTSFHPPDLFEAGADLAALPVVRVETPLAATRAADRLLRSGGFGLVVIDFGAAGPTSREVPLASQTRLAGLARKHRTALLCLTRKSREAPSIGSLVSLRAEGTVQKTGFDRFTWSLRALKDKALGPGWSYEGVCRGPEGLC